MKIILKPLQFLYVIYAFIVFVALMIPVFVWALAVIPFGKIKGGNLIYRGCMVWADIWFALIFIHHKNIYEQKPRKGASYIFVANHISYMDVPVIVKTFRQPVRPLGKAQLAKVPVFGFIYKNAIVTVDRSDASHRAQSVRLLKSIINKGISVLVFPEGTFNETNKPLKHFYDGAFRVAIETGTPIKPVILLDTYDRLHYRSIFTLTPGKCRAIFLHEVPTSGLTVDDVKSLKERVYTLMEEKLLEYNATWIHRH